MPCNCKKNTKTVRRQNVAAVKASKAKPSESLRAARDKIKAAAK